MKKYFFYAATGQGVVALQNPAVASSVGVPLNPKVYSVKLSPGASLSAVPEGTNTTESNLITQITSQFPGAKIIMESVDSKNVSLLN